MREITILIGGDTVPTERDSELFQRGDRTALFGEVLPEIEAADLFALNLECPLTNSTAALPKIGPNLRAAPGCVNGLTIAHAINLANNHILDFGEAGISSTLELCQSHGILTFGAGESLARARQPLIREIKGWRVGLLGVAENEFSSATASTAGAYGLDLIDLIGNLREQRSKMDFCVLLYHGGNEHYPYPSPRLQDLCRFLVESGADAVICQHSHCAGCYERHGNGLIVYGQGNLIFDGLPHRQPAWSEGFLVKLRPAENGQLDFWLVPYVQSTPEPGLRRMTGAREDEFRRQIESRSRQILDRQVVERCWADFCGRLKDQYLGGVYLPESRYVSAVNRRVHFADRLLSRRRKRRLLNLIGCESHHDVLKTLLKDSI